MNKTKIDELDSFLSFCTYSRSRGLTLFFFFHFSADITPEELFNMFFGGPMPGENLKAKGKSIIELQGYNVKSTCRKRSMEKTLLL